MAHLDWRQSLSRFGLHLNPYPKAWEGDSEVLGKADSPVLGKATWQRERALPFLKATENLLDIRVKRLLLSSATSSALPGRLGGLADPLLVEGAVLLLQRGSADFTSRARLAVLVSFGGHYHGRATFGPALLATGARSLGISLLRPPCLAGGLASLAAGLTPATVLPEG